MNEIKQDISSLRYELLEIFRNNKMVIPANERREGKALQGSKNARVKHKIKSLAVMRMMFDRVRNSTAVFHDSRLSCQGSAAKDKWRQIARLGCKRKNICKPESLQRQERFDLNSIEMAGNSSQPNRADITTGFGSDNNNWHWQ